MKERTLFENRVLTSDDYNYLISRLNRANDEILRLAETILRRRAYAEGCSGDGGFWAKITGNASDGTNRYKYAWQEVVKTKTGYTTASWEAKDPGLSGTTSETPARNTVEAPNISSGTLGNGVAIDSLVGSFALKPVTTGVIVRMWRAYVRVESEVVIEYWFSYENGIDGGCP